MVYAAAVNRHSVVIIDGGSPFDEHYLFVDLDPDGVVQNYEVVRSVKSQWTHKWREPCRLNGECVHRDPWVYKPNPFGFGLGAKERPDNWNIAVLTGTQATEAIARNYAAGAGECVILVYTSTGAISDFGLSIDKEDWQGLTPDTFVWRRLLVGKHQINTSIGVVHKPKYEQQFTVDCESGATLYIQLVTTGGVWRRAQIESVRPSAETARRDLQERRMVLE